MKNIYKSIIALSALGIVSSCESLVDDINTSPNDPRNAPAELMVPGIELANLTIHEGSLARLAGLWTGYFTGEDRQYISYENYTVTSGDFDTDWGNLYSGVVKNARIVRDKAEAVNDDGSYLILNTNSTNSNITIYVAQDFDRIVKLRMQRNKENDGKSATNG